ncbi:carboxypeptidase-like regulatory domain-containing protein [Pedobacter nyackensis]|uniref:carboxypeptidase-like regulatory domain-containing protein n=1 Tax=Pedobacter nyackensis TaxID=475255 RepID=UPI00292E2852|nr:carboxypeptidase-like regulatory domain-containing protein [Pedobacter nyackensis]
MRRIGVNFLMVAGLVLSLLGFTFIKTGSIQGKVAPAEGVSQVLAVLGTDTLNTTINNGSFAFRNVKIGTYTIVIKANAPFKDLSIKNVAVIDSATTDVGLIKLQ